MTAYGSFYNTNSGRQSFAANGNVQQPSASLEDKLAKELQRIKLENESKKREIEKICAESDELRKLKGKINSGYVNKERSAQIAESHIRKLNEIVTIIFAKLF